MNYEQARHNMIEQQLHPWQVSDATVIVVSEERGEVSVASKGHLAVMPDAEQLKETLNNVIEH